MDKTGIQSPPVDYDLDFIKLIANCFINQQIIKTSIEAIKKAETMFGDDRSFNFYYHPLSFLDNKIYQSAKMYSKRDLKNIRDYSLTHFPNNLPNTIPDIDKNYIILLQNSTFFLNLFHDLQEYIESRKLGKVYEATIIYPSFFSNSLNRITMAGDKLLYIYRNATKFIEM